MVAPSFQQFEQLGEPYQVSGKMYVRVRNPKTGTERQVRWYTEAEYTRAYSTAQVEPKAKEYTCQKHALGFDNGYILLFKGDIEGNEEWLRREVRCRYTRLWGWFIPSDVETPAIPAGLTTVRLDWELVGKPSGALKEEKEVVAAVEKVLYDSNPSEWQGAVGERLDLTLTVTANYARDNAYGINHVHYFVDDEQNVYGWSTNAKDWPVDAVKRIRGTVRSHETYKNTKITWLTRCTEVK
jgi:hypothetical protein